MPTYTQIPYTFDGAYTKDAYQKRFGSSHRKSGKNLASAGLKSGTVLTEWSAPELNMHSEQILLSKIAKPNEEIVWLYTERMPCGYGPGLRDCRSTLNSNLAAGVPVYFTAPYYEGDDLEPTATSILGSKFYTLKEDSRSLVNAEAKYWRQSIASDNPMWDLVWQGEIPAHLLVDTSLFNNLS
jgi:hypothetical protein